MITRKDLDINNKSYTNKDFQTTYTELLDLIPYLTSRWDPALSNESDPGVVLLKLLAFIADKNNYNIDKNTLERFMASLTQENSMREQSSRLGYNMKYYNSATTKVNIVYIGDKLVLPGDYFTLKAFDTSFTDVDNSVNYILTEDQIISVKGKSYTVPVIEGSYQELTILGNNIIQLQDLDDNNRIYFPEREVAENGVYIYNEDNVNNYWKKEDNLNRVTWGNKVFKFGYDSGKRLPYIEFPEDISSLIENGIIIKYIRTNGIRGNIKSSFLTEIVSGKITLVTSDPNANITVYPIQGTTGNEKVFIISNAEGSINGRDPETINEAYKNFKRTIGTFNNLIAGRDYKNAIYEMADNNQNPLVSNVQVADRRTDINYVNKIMSFNNYGDVLINKTDPDEITPYDLCIYPLRPITNYNLEEYKNSFRPLNNIWDITYNLEKDEGNLSHNYKEVITNNIHCIKNYYSLKSRISTVNKVNPFEQKIILDNINKALFKKFNSREIDYGYEIPYETILQTIEQADPRIKNVSLDEPILTPKVMLGSGDEVALTGDKYIEMLSKNILAGKINLFEVNTDFVFSLGQSKNSNFSTLYEDIETVTTKLTIKPQKIKDTTINNYHYQLKDNENIQIAYPSLVEEVPYPSGTYFNSNFNLNANIEYKLQGTNVLYVYYTLTDSNNEDRNYLAKYTPTQTDIYKVVDGVAIIEDSKTVTENIFKSNFNITISTGTSSKVVTLNGTDINLFPISNTEKIEKRIFIDEILTDTIHLHWRRRNNLNALFTEDDLVSGDTTTSGVYSIILGEGESIFYTNPGFTLLSVLGPGTKITLTLDAPFNASNWIISENLVELEDLLDRGLRAFNEYNWKVVHLNNTSNLKLEEMTITTLAKDAIFRVSTIDFGSWNVDINNSSQPIPGNVQISYKLSGDDHFTNLPLININNTGYSVISRLNLNVGLDLKQYLSSEGSGADLIKEQVIEITDENSVTTPLKNCYIQTNHLAQVAGGDNLDLSVMYLDGEVEKLKVLVFDYTVPVLPVGSDSYVDDNKQTIIKIPNTIPSPFEVNFPLLKLDNQIQLVMIYWNKVAREGSDPDLRTIALSKTGTGASIIAYNSGSTSQITSLNTGINILQLTDVESFKLTLTGFETGDQDTIVVGNVLNSTGYNEALQLTTTQINTLLTNLRTKATIDGSNLFNYTKIPNNYEIIDYEDLTDPNVLWDTNNLYNRFTIAQISFDSDTDIDIARSSKV